MSNRPDDVPEAPDEEHRAVTVEVVETTIHAVDRMDDRVTVETTGWDEIDPPHDTYQGPDSDMDAVIGGRLSELAVEAKFPLLVELDDQEEPTENLAIDSGERYDLSPSEYVLEVETPITISVRFGGPATVEMTESDDLVLSFEQPEPVSIGFRSWVQQPEQTVTVPKTTAGVATAISNSSAALETTESLRSTEGPRGHPPLIRFGETVDVPRTVREEVPDTGLELTVPDRLDVLLQVGSLAYYLGADVRLEAGEPAIRTQDGTVLHEFAEPPTFQYEVAAFLRRVFLIDSLVHHDQSVQAEPVETDLLDELDLDPATYDEVDDVERLRRVLDANFEAVSAALPEWHAVNYVEPTFENVRGLPYFMRYLGAVFDPAAYPTGGGDDRVPNDPLIQDTIPDRVWDETPFGSSIGWLASDPRPDRRPFVVHPDAFANENRYADRADGDGRIVVVCNDDRRRSESNAVADRYRTHTSADTAVESYSMTTRNELAQVFQDGADLLHFVGPIDDGLACEDGHLAPSDLDTVNVRLFVFDDGGSTETARACLENGSVGGVAIEGVHPPSSTVRESLTGLLVRGATIDLAVRCATAADPDSGLVAMGDGFQQLVRPATLHVALGTVEPQGPNRFALTVYPYIPEAGFSWRPEPLDRRSQLCAKPFEATVSGPDLMALIDTENLIPMIDGTVHWDDTRDFFNPLV